MLYTYTKKTFFNSLFIYLFIPYFAASSFFRCEMSLVVCSVHSRKLIVCNIRNRIIQFVYTNLGSTLLCGVIILKLWHLEEEEREKEKKEKIILNIFQYRDKINISIIIISKRYVSGKLITIYLIQSWSLARRQKRLRHVIQ